MRVFTFLLIVKSQELRLMVNRMHRSMRSYEVNVNFDYIWRVGIASLCE